MNIPSRLMKNLVVLGMAGAFLLLGALFALAPRWGAMIFGVTAPEGEGLAYVRAIGFRDMALGLYILGLRLWATRRALGIVLGLTVLIPVLDLALLLVVKGLSSPWHLALHGASAVCFTAVAIWVAGGRAEGQDRAVGDRAHTELGGSP